MGAPAAQKHICGCGTHFDEDRWTSVTDSQCDFHATHYPDPAPVSAQENTND